MSNLEPFDAWILPALVVALGVLLGVTISWALRLREQLVARVSPPKIPRGSKFASVVLLGLAGVGKTALAYTLTRGEDLGRALQTQSTRQHETIWTLDRQGSLYLYILDGPGRNPGDLIRELVAAQSRPYSPFRFECITALVLMLDLVDVDRRIHSVDSGLEKLQADEHRIQAHLKTWSETTVQAILGLAPHEVQVIVFVNKLDLLGLRSRNQIQYFKPILHALKHAGAKNVRVIEGSVLTGEGISDIRETLLKESVGIERYANFRERRESFL